MDSVADYGESLEKVRALEAQLAETKYMLKKHEEASKGNKSVVRTMEKKLVSIEREQGAINKFMTGNKYAKSQEKTMKKAGLAAVATTQKQQKKVKKAEKSGALWKSPNTVATIMELQARSFEAIPDDEIVDIKFSWCLVFDMPEVSHAKSNTVRFALGFCFCFCCDCVSAPASLCCWRRCRYRCRPSEPTHFLIGRLASTSTV
jgi:hypothetical protein